MELLKKQPYEVIETLMLNVLTNSEACYQYYNDAVITNKELDGIKSRSIQINEAAYTLTIVLDAKTKIPTRKAKKLIRVLNMGFQSGDQTILNAAAKDFRITKGVLFVGLRTDKVIQYRYLSEGVHYQLNGLYINLKGTNADKLVRVSYEGLTVRYVNTFYIKEEEGNMYVICDPTKERFYHTSEPIETLLKLIK